MRKTDMNKTIGRLKRLKNYRELPFADKFPLILDIMLDNCYKDKIQKIYLFGSYAYGKPTEDSDLDFCVIIDDEVVANHRDVSFRIKINLKHTHYIPNDVLVYNESTFNKCSSVKGFEDIIKKYGKVLYER